MCQCMHIILIGLSLYGLVQMVAPKTAEGTLSRSRQTGEPCSTCHDVIPKLNHTGLQFRANGFRLPNLTDQNTSLDETPRPRTQQRSETTSSLSYQQRNLNDLHEREGH